MTTIKIELGVLEHITYHYGPGVKITIDGDHALALALEVLEYLEKFESPAGQIEVR
jgi:hypothetical protein